MLADTNDNKAVFGARFGDYNDNEISRGMHFDDWWPDLYACKEGEAYELHMPDGKVIKTFQSKEGNDAIDRPLFAVLKEIDLTTLNKSVPFVLGVEMVSSSLAETWIPTHC